MDFIDLKRQYRRYRDEIDRAVSQVMESAGFILGPKVQELEEKLAAFAGVPRAVGVSSGTDALLLALMAAGVGPGDRVITTPFTFVATAEVLSLLGAEPLFVDIEEGTMNIDPARVEEAALRCEAEGHPAKGIIPVSIFGLCPEMDAINATAQRLSLFVLEDACQSFGATYKGKCSCGLCHMAATSFFPSKPLGAYGDGGMVFCQDPDLADRIRALRCHGERARYNHEWIGMNARLDALQAAVLLVKFAHFPDEIRMRQEAADRYQRLISEAGLEGVRLQEIPPHCSSVYAQFTIRIEADREGSGQRRDRIARAMADMGIPTAIHYPRPLHLQPAFSYLGLSEGTLPVAERACSEVLSLPMHPFITKQEQEQVIGALTEAIRQ